jgi:hypothetical protein
MFVNKPRKQIVFYNFQRNSKAFCKIPLKEKLYQENDVHTKIILYLLFPIFSTMPLIISKQYF